MSTGRWINATELADLNRQMTEYLRAGHRHPRALKPIKPSTLNKPRVTIQEIRDEDTYTENVAPSLPVGRGFRFLKTTTTGDLLGLAAKYDIPGFQVFSSDTLPKKLQTDIDQSFIINVDPLKSQRGGTHWVCLYAGPRQQEVIYFDPFGIDPQPSILKLMRTVKSKSRIGSTIQAQLISAESCGQWCIFVLHMLTHGRSLFDIMKSLDAQDQHKNEQLLKKFFSKR